MPDKAAMEQLNAPGVSTVSEAFFASVQKAGAELEPYPHWILTGCLPDPVADELASLPLSPPHIDDTQGRRETHNDLRVHFGAENRGRFAVVDNVARAFQSQEVVGVLEAATGARLSGTSLRIEYCQDTDGFWLEPHTDIGVKKFTLLIYLNREAEAAGWGTDIYSDPQTHIGHAPAGFNNGLIFVPSDRTWHGFEKRPIHGVRKSIIVNYVGPAWRNRHELCFPDTTVG